MAEEIVDENVQQPVQEEPSVHRKITISGKMTIPDSFSSGMGAKPEALDIFKNIVGNPLTGSNPGGKQQAQQLDDSNFIENISHTAQKKASQQDNPYYNMRPFTYNGDYDGANFERYYGTNEYKTLGFSPYRDNESLYNEKMTLGDQFVRSASQWPSLFKTGLMSGITSWGDIFTDPLAPDIESARSMQRAMAIGNSGSGGVSGFLANTFLNSAYTVGIGMEMLGETLLLAGATAATGGADIEATAPAWMARMGLGAGKITEGVKAGVAVAGANEALESFKALKTVGQAKTFWSTLPGKGLNIINPLEHTMDALRATDYATNYAKAVNTVGAFAKDVVMTHAAVSEAKLEGGMVKLDVTRDLIDEYRKKNLGRDPEGKDLEKIENLATQEALRTGLWNLPAIMWSNKFMYETMLAPIEKLVKINPAKEGALHMFDKDVFKEVGDSFLDKTKLAAKGFANPRVYGKYAMNYLKANLAEGVQENLQEAISSGAIQHAMSVYKDQGKGAYEGYLGYFMKGLGEQFSAQGAETFAGGFVMGMFAQPMMAAPSMALSKALDATVNKGKIAKYKEARDLQRTSETGMLNDLYKNLNIALAPDINNAIRQGYLSDDLYSALNEGKQKRAVDAKDDSFREHLYTALRTGHYDVFINKLKDYKNLSPEEAKDAFKDVGVIDGAEALKHIDAVVARAEQLKDDYESTSNEFSNPFSPRQYTKDSSLYRANVVAYHAWEEAKKNLIFAKSAFKRHGERMEDLAGKLSALSNHIAKADAHSMLSLLDPKTTGIEIATLKEEIKALDLVIPGNARIRAQKEKQLEHLYNFHEAIKNHQDNVLNQVANETFENKDPEIEKKFNETETEAFKAFKTYVQYLGKKHDSPVFDTDIRKAYDIVKDHLILKDERNNLTRSINLLSNPKGFMNLQLRLQAAGTQLLDDMPDILESNSKLFTALKEVNNSVNVLAKVAGVVVTPEFMKSLENAVKNNTIIPIPTEFIDPKTGEKITAETNPERFEKAIELWRSSAELIGKTEVEKPAETTELVVLSTTPTDISKIDINDISTFPPALMEQINDVFSWMKEVFPDAVLEEEYATNEDMKGLVRAYIINNGGVVAEAESAPVDDTKQKEQEAARANLEKLRAEAKQAMPEKFIVPETPAVIEVRSTTAQREVLPKTLEELEGRQVERDGSIGTIQIAGADNVSFITDNVEYKIKGADISSDPANFGFQGLLKDVEPVNEVKSVAQPEVSSKYNITNISESLATVNGVNYIINTDTSGNIISLSPENKPEQQLTNEKLIVAVEVERNKLDYDLPEEVINEVVESKKKESPVTVILEGIMADNLTETVARGLNKLYTKEQLTANEQLQVELWVFDALDQVDDLLRKDAYRDNESLKNAFYSLRIINHLLHGQKTDVTQSETGTQQAPVTNNSQKGKRTISKRSGKQSKTKTVTKVSPVKVAPVVISSINQDSLTDAMEKRYEVVYNALDQPDIAGRYLVKRVNKKSVILSRPGSKDIKISMEAVSSVIKEIIKPGEVKTTVETQETITGNQTVVKELSDPIISKSVEDATKDFLDKLC